MAHKLKENESFDLLFRLIIKSTSNVDVQLEFVE
jgi:hypothetical protein